MAKKSLKRQITDLETKKMTKLLYQMDILAAAYARSCQIHPTECCIVVEELPPDEQKKKDKRLKYYFMHHEPKVNDQSAHPDVKILMSTAMILTDAHKKNDQATIQEVLNDLTTFMQKYEDADGDQDQSGQVVQNEIGQEGGDSKN